MNIAVKCSIRRLLVSAIILNIFCQAVLFWGGLQVLRTSFYTTKAYAQPRSTNFARKSHQMTAYPQMHSAFPLIPHNYPPAPLVLQHPNMKRDQLSVILIGFLFATLTTLYTFGYNATMMTIPCSHLKEAVDRSQDYARCIADGSPLILMVDDRVKDGFDPYEETQNFVLLTVTLNRLYAIRHGYCFKLVKSNSTCAHVKYGERDPQWCKILPIASALEDGFATIMFFDSDAYIHNISISIPFFLAAMRNQTIPSTDRGFGWNPPSDEELASRLNNQTDELLDQAAVILTADWGQCEINTGVMIFRNGDVARRMVSAWWDVDDHAKEFDREQFAFREYIYKKAEWAGHIARLPVNAMNYDGWFVRHYATDRPNDRLTHVKDRIIVTVIEAVHYGNRKNHGFDSLLRLLQT
jgi:hypothetical protein